MPNKHFVVNGDSRNMSLIDDESVHLIVTSPPYWQLKDYGTEDQIGFNQDYENYINNLNLVWSECNRVLHPGCRLCINIGDQFARSVYYGRYKVIPIRTEIIRFCESLKMDYMGAIIWQKKTTMNTTGGASIMGSYPYPRNGIVKIDYEFILLFKKPGIAPKPTASQKEASAMTRKEWNEYFNGHWYFAGAKQNEHLAMFPLELPTRLIRMFSFEGETVLDPFLGSGTTSLAAMRTNRKSWGYEINPKYIDVIRNKLNPEQRELFESPVQYLEDHYDPPKTNVFDKLPYIFIDPHKIDKKVDVKKMNFGSKIDDSKPKKTESFEVEKVLSPEHMLLTNGLKIKLLGVKEKPEQRNAAMRFLEEKIGRQPVYIRFDKEKYDENNTLMGYLYLKNKTFINLHLLKNKLVDYDSRYKFKYGKTFKELQI
ncbi:MAG: DNA methyltransferase [Candidatus Cloacimonadaceae bacterium]